MAGIPDYIPPREVQREDPNAETRRLIREGIIGKYVPAPRIIPKPPEKKS